MLKPISYLSMSLQASSLERAHPKKQLDPSIYKLNVAASALCLTTYWVLSRQAEQKTLNQGVRIFRVLGTTTGGH